MKANSEKIKRASRALKTIFLVTLCALPLMDAGFWITNGYPFLQPFFDWDIMRYVPTHTPIDQMSGTLKLWGFLANLIPTTFDMIALFWVAKLFGLFEHLHIFTEQSVKYLRRVGWVLLVAQLVYPLYMGIISFILTVSNPPGHRLVMVSFGTQQAGLLVVSIVILLLSWIMDEGRKLQEEQEATV